MAFLRKRGKVWCGAWWEGHGKDRRKRLKSFHTRDPKQAIKELDKLNDDLAAQKGGREPEMSWTTFCRQYLEWSQAHKTTESHRRDKIAIRDFDRVVFLKDMKGILAYHLERFKIERKRSGVKDSTINRDMNTLKAMAGKAVEWGCFKINPWGPVKKFQLHESAPETFAGKEDAILSACQTPAERVLACLGLYQGLRRGEMANLMWEDIDLNAGMMRVVSTMGRRTKSKRERMVPLHQKTAKSLKRLSRVPGKGFVLGFSGRKAVEDTLSYQFKDILIRLGIPGHLHLTRHTLGTNLAHAKVDPRTIMDIMGHSRITTTQIYLHTNEDAKRRAIQALR